VKSTFPAPSSLVACTSASRYCSSG
jgi:hypothetical protein